MPHLARSLWVAVLASTLAACGGGGGDNTGGGGTGTSASTSTSTSATTGTGGGAGGAKPDAGPPPVCGTGSAGALGACVEQARYEADLTTVAVERPPGSAGWQAVQDLCADRFAALGFQVERQSYGTGVNVVGTLQGSSAPTEKVVLSAHYDAVPGCPGADDNGSGVAGLLEAARVLAQGKYARTLVVACWDQEEAGLIGSKAYVTQAKADGASIVAAFVFETMGYKSDEPGSQSLPAGFSIVFPEQTAALQANGSKGDFVAVIGDASIEAPLGAFSAAAATWGLPAVSLVLSASDKNSAMFMDLRRSDHAAFWAADYPALMLTDTANFRNTHYHCGGGVDAVADLDAAFTTKIVRSTVSAVAETLGVQ